MKLRKRLAVCCAKLLHQAIRRMNLGHGTTLPGSVARRIDPAILSDLADMIQEKIIVTMGTNGKTTTNNLLFRALEQAGKTVVCNHMGANMANGITTAFVAAAGKTGTLHADYACLEVDEFSAGTVLPELKPDYILLTNIFRDQLDRYGEMDIVCQRIREAISLVPEATLILNCDDIFSYTLACSCQNPVVFYGINEPAFASEGFDGYRDSLFCHICGSRLSYDFFHYGHLGLYHCPTCHLNRPTPSYTATDILFSSDSCSFYINGHLLRIGTTAACHVYNTLSAYAVLCTAGISVSQFDRTVSFFDFSNHREEAFLINGSHVQLYLAKNPVGFQQKLGLIGRDPSPKAILFQINDHAPDGRDVSWLWDVNFDGFAGIHATLVMAAGLRRYDMALRLKYEDIPCRISDDTEAAISQLLREKIGNLYIVTNYSGLYPINRFLHRLCSASADRKSPP